MRKTIKERRHGAKEALLRFVEKGNLDPGFGGGERARLFAPPLRAEYERVANPFLDIREFEMRLGCETWYSVRARKRICYGSRGRLEQVGRQIATKPTRQVKQTNKHPGTFLKANFPSIAFQGLVWDRESRCIVTL